MSCVHFTRLLGLPWHYLGDLRVLSLSLRNRDFSPEQNWSGDRCDADRSYLFKYVSTISMWFLGLIYNPNPGYTVANHSKWAEREVALTIRHRKMRAFQICIQVHIYCTISGMIGVSYTDSENLGYTLGNPKWAERVVVVGAIRRRKFRALQICIHFHCAIIGVSFSELKIIKASLWMPWSKKMWCDHFRFRKKHQKTSTVGDIAFWNGNYLFLKCCPGIF